MRHTPARLVARTAWFVGLAMVAAMTTTGQAAAADGTDYATSFDTDQPQPDWTDTVETDPAGTPRQDGLADGMASAVGTGPEESPTAATGVGYSGAHSLAISGKHADDGAAYAYNKVLDVDIAVTDTSQLSYLVFPVHMDDLRDPSTYVSLDLAFTDGSYLSQLDAVDQHGAVLNPRAQGESKTLYTDQWNRKAADIGAVASGKTIDRILVGYDNPEGPATEFAAFVDDIDIVGAPETPDVTVPAIGHSPPAAPSRPETSPAATTSRRPPCRTGSTSTPRSPTPTPPAGSTSTSGPTPPTTVRRCRRSRSATSPVRGWVTGRPSR